MEYQVALAPAAEKQMDRLSRQRARADAVAELSRNPRPHGAIKLQGGDDLYRLRVGNYRVVYAV